MELVILAAGMGSRFGGLKQIEPIDEYGNFIIDYSIYDAIEAGFDTAIFIIKEENYDDFRNTIGKRIENKIKVKYAFQKTEDVPSGYTCPKDRTKPWGTAHAIMAARDQITDNFIIINADDFYGKESFRVAADFIKSIPNGTQGKYANVLYNVANTMAENGSVKRGVCFAKPDGTFDKLIESSIERNAKGEIVATPLDTKIPEMIIPETTPVSMNMFVFTKDLVDTVVNGMPAFLDENKDNMLKCEYLIPTVVSDKVNVGEATLDMLTTTAIWYGMTYKEDKPMVVSSIKALVDAGQYKPGLWK